MSFRMCMTGRYSENVAYEERIPFTAFYKFCFSLEFHCIFIMTLKVLKFYNSWSCDGGKCNKYMHWLVRQVPPVLWMCRYFPPLNFRQRMSGILNLRCGTKFATNLNFYCTKQLIIEFRMHQIAILILPKFRRRDSNWMHPIGLLQKGLVFWVVCLAVFAGSSLTKGT